MRVLLTTDPIGGVWTFTRELSQELLRLGHSVYLLSFGRELAPNQTEWCRSTARGAAGSFTWEASHAPLEWMQENEQTWTNGVAAIHAAVASFAPDILHTSQFCFGNFSRTLPSIVTAHSDVLSWAEACRPQGLEQSRWLATYCELVSRGIRRATAIAAPTQWMADALSRHWIVKQEIGVIANGRSVTGVSGAGLRKMQALSAGRLWDEAKGLATLRERDWPMPVLVAGEQSFEGAHAQGSGKVCALGALSEDEMLAAMRQSAIYIGTSLYEPFGLAPLEAAKCGCALVMRDLESFREVWGEAAMYFDDADTLHQALNTLRYDTAFLGVQRDAALRQATKYDASAMAAAYVHLYEDAIMSHQKPLTREVTLECDAA